jgi:hypothetical protein
MGIATTISKKTRKTEANKPSSASHPGPQLGEIIDNRPTAITQNKLSNGLSNSPKANKTTQLQSIIAGSGVVQQAPLSPDEKGLFRPQKDIKADLAQNGLTDGAGSDVGQKEETTNEEVKQEDPLATQEDQKEEAPNEEAKKEETSESKEGQEDLVNEPTENNPAKLTELANGIKASLLDMGALKNNILNGVTSKLEEKFPFKKENGDVTGLKEEHNNAVIEAGQMEALKTLGSRIPVIKEKLSKPDINELTEFKNELEGTGGEILSKAQEAATKRNSMFSKAKDVGKYIKDGAEQEEPEEKGADTTHAADAAKIGKGATDIAKVQQNILDTQDDIENTKKQVSDWLEAHHLDPISVSENSIKASVSKDFLKPREGVDYGKIADISQDVPLSPLFGIHLGASISAGITAGGEIEVSFGDYFNRKKTDTTDLNKLHIEKFKFQKENEAQKDLNPEVYNEALAEIDKRINTEEIKFLDRDQRPKEFGVNASANIGASITGHAEAGAYFGNPFLNVNGSLTGDLTAEASATANINGKLSKPQNGQWEPAFSTSFDLAGAVTASVGGSLGYKVGFINGTFASYTFADWKIADLNAHAKIENGETDWGAGAEVIWNPKPSVSEELTKLKDSKDAVNDILGNQEEGVTSAEATDGKEEEKKTELSPKELEKEKQKIEAKKNKKDLLNKINDKDTDDLLAQIAKLDEKLAANKDGEKDEQAMEDRSAILEKIKMKFDNVQDQSAMQGIESQMIANKSFLNRKTGYGKNAIEEAKSNYDNFIAAQKRADTERNEKLNELTFEILPELQNNFDQCATEKSKIQGSERSEERKITEKIDLHQEKITATEKRIVPLNQHISQLELLNADLKAQDTAKLFGTNLPKDILAEIAANKVEITQLKEEAKELQKMIKGYQAEIKKLTKSSMFSEKNNAAKYVSAKIAFDKSSGKLDEAKAKRSFWLNDFPDSAARDSANAKAMKSKLDELEKTYNKMKKIEELTAK